MTKEEWLRFIVEQRDTAMRSAIVEFLEELPDVCLPTPEDARSMLGPEEYLGLRLEGILARAYMAKEALMGLNGRVKKPFIVE